MREPRALWLGRGASHVRLDRRALAQPIVAGKLRVLSSARHKPGYSHHGRSPAETFAKLCHHRHPPPEVQRNLHFAVLGCCRSSPSMRRGGRKLRARRAEIGALVTREFSRNCIGGSHPSGRRGVGALGAHHLPESLLGRLPAALRLRLKERRLRARQHQRQVGDPRTSAMRCSLAPTRSLRSSPCAPIRSPAETECGVPSATTRRRRLIPAFQLSSTRTGPQSASAGFPSGHRCYGRWRLPFSRRACSRLAPQV
jgi:hypothetical protein